MDTFLADTLTRAETTLSEGQYLAVADILKKVHKNTEQPREIVSLSSTISGVSATGAGYQIEITSFRRVGDEGVFEFKVTVNDTPTPPLRQDYDGLVNCFRLLSERLHPIEIKYKSRDMVTSWTLSVHIESLIGQCRSGDYTTCNMYESIEEYIFNPLFHMSRRDTSA
jgi:hypothetical protein